MSELTILQKAIKTLCAEKVYLGDSVYAMHDGYHIVLTTENGFSDDPRNTIALEPMVYDHLITYKERLYAQIQVLQERDKEMRKEDEKMLSPDNERNA